MYHGKKIVVTGASRDFGVTLTWNFARQGATVYVVCRKMADAQATCAQVEKHVHGAQVHPLECDLTRPRDVGALGARLRELTGELDVLVNNGAMWLQSGDFLAASDEDIAATIDSGAVGPVLVTKHMLPLLQAGGRGDIVNMVSKCGETAYEGSPAHEAFYAMKHAHAGFAAILGRRLRASGVRTLSLFPPKFDNTSPFDPAWNDVPQGDHMRRLNARTLVETIDFALAQPRSAFISEIRFEDNRIPD